MAGGLGEQELYGELGGGGEFGAPRGGLPSDRGVTTRPREAVSGLPERARGSPERAG
jgi:hypothetical protein